MPCADNHSVPCHCLILGKTLACITQHGYLLYGKKRKYYIIYISRGKGGGALHYSKVRILYSSDKSLLFRMSPYKMIQYRMHPMSCDRKYMYIYIHWFTPAHRYLNGMSTIHSTNVMSLKSNDPISYNIHSLIEILIIGLKKQLFQTYCPAL